MMSQENCYKPTRMVGYICKARSSVAISPCELTSAVGVERSVAGGSHSSSNLSQLLIPSVTLSEMIQQQCPPPTIMACHALTTGHLGVSENTNMMCPGHGRCSVGAVSPGPGWTSPGVIWPASWSSTSLWSVPWTMVRW